MKPVRVLAATCVASLPLWPSVAGAGGEPDQELTAEHTFVVDGVSCPVDIAARRFGDVAVVTTDVQSADPRCRSNILMSGRFSDVDTGDERVVWASGMTQSLTMQVQQISRIRSTRHDLLFTWNNSSTVDELQAPK